MAKNIFYGLSIINPAPVAQLDRASDYGSEGWGFDSLQARHLFTFRKKYNHGRRIKEKERRRTQLYGH